MFPRCSPRVGWCHPLKFWLLKSGARLGHFCGSPSLNPQERFRKFPDRGKPLIVRMLSNIPSQGRIGDFPQDNYNAVRPHQTLVNVMFKSSGRFPVTRDLKRLSRSRDAKQQFTSQNPSSEPGREPWQDRPALCSKSAWANQQPREIGSQCSRSNSADSA